MRSTIDGVRSNAASKLYTHHITHVPLPHFLICLAFDTALHTRILGEEGFRRRASVVVVRSFFSKAVRARRGAFLYIEGV